MDMGVESPKKSALVLPPGISVEHLTNAYRLMQTSRALDQKMLIMIRQGKSYFHIGCMGHEAVQVAAGFALTPRKDFLFPYYRDQALCLTLGEKPEECLLAFFAKATDPHAGGRQMPMHYGHKELNIPTSSSSTGTQFLQSVGCALATKHRKTNEVSLVCTGEGTTSQGDFHEALNWASREKLPVVFLVENNGYAISVPIQEQRSASRVSVQGKGYPGLFVEEVDGCDFLASFEVLSKAVQRARSGNGPTLIDATVVRLLPHSSSDDDKKYRSKEELDQDRTQDPLPRMRHFLIEQGVLSAAEIDKIDTEIKMAIDDAADRAESAANPDPKTATWYVDSGEPEPALTEPQIDPDSPEIVLVDAINRALADEMGRDKNVLVFGQDVAGGKGGVFTATRGLTSHFGVDRCFNAPLAESSIVGVAIGLAMRGYKPVPEIQFADYIWTAMMQIRNELTTVRYRSNNAFSAPVVIRVPVGGYIHGGLCHSQNIEATFAHFPGIKIALPSTALDAYGLLKAAIRCNDPVLFLEHKALYRQNFAKSKLPKDPNWVLPFGKASVRRKGRDITVITYGIMVNRALEAAREMERVGVDIEVIDLRTIRPFDWDAIEQSVKKTSKVLVLHEDSRFMGFGAELAAEISEKCFADLDAPVKRLAGKEAPIPYSQDLEEVILVQPADILAALKELAAY